MACLRQGPCSLRQPLAIWSCCCRVVLPAPPQITCGPQGTPGQEVSSALLASQALYSAVQAL